jgi:hypothetical protein
MRQLNLDFFELPRTSSKELALHRISTLVQKVSSSRELTPLERDIYVEAQSSLTPTVSKESILSYLRS